MDIATFRNSIDTIVVVMMENRSFDHLLGYLSHEKYGGRTDVNGLHVNGPTFDWGNAAEGGAVYQPEHAADGYLATDLPHERSRVAVQINDGAMDGFVKAYFGSQALDRGVPPVPMRFCAPTDVPVTAALADAYCVCDNWFAALPVDTQPNRLMAMSGQTLIDSTSDIKPVTHWLPEQPTILDWLTDKGAAFEIYVDAPFIATVGYPSNFVLMQSQWRHLDAHAFGLDSLHDRWNMPGPAPSVVYCEPYYNDLATTFGGHGNCNHPPLPLAYGEAFLKKVYEMLTSNRARWARTVMVICYDEHGGFFDHVSPPAMPCAPPQGSQWHDPRPYTTLGVRVPGIVVSPVVGARSVFSGLLDHTSILQLVVDRFGSPDDLAFFGDAIARKTDANNPVQSLTAALTGVTSRNDIVSLPTPALAMPAAPSTMSANSRLFTTAMQAKAKATSGSAV